MQNNTAKLFIGLGLNEVELATSLARSAIYLRMKQHDNPAYATIAQLLDRLAEETFNKATQRASSTQE